MNGYGRAAYASSIAVGLFGALYACGGNEQPAKGPGGQAPVEQRSTEVTHEACDGSKVENIDTNGDGKPDIKRVYNGAGREICRVTDLNHNGKPDLYQYFDEQGNVRRREADYDESGVVDAIEYYQAGKLVRVEYDTLARHKLDTWDFFDPATGKRVRRERDSKGTGHIDQWWTWEGDKVSVAFDRNSDGQPDPSDILTVGEANAKGAAAAADAAPPPSTASQVGSMDGGSLTPVAQPTATPPPLAPLPDAGAPKADKSKPKGKK